MNVKRLATPFQYSLIGLFALASLWPARAFAEDGHAHVLSSQQREPTPDQRSKASAFVQIVRESTERFSDVAAAEAEGYGLLFGCVSGPDAGAMGLHYVNLSLLAASMRRAPTSSSTKRSRTDA